VSGGFVASAVAAGALLAVLGHHAGVAQAQAKPGSAAAQAIAYARAQLGKPYVWGGTGPGAFDCSGLVMQAYAAAGASIARTSQAQWATERQVSTSEPGDLVFFPGADGTPASPGHVGIVVDPARNLMIDAYASGFPVEYDTYGPGASKQGLSDPVGFTDPARGS
jgi:cell wall-associated NlpC family hydrolase